MSEKYIEIKKQIPQARAALYVHKNISLNKIAQKFCVLIQRLQSRLIGHSNARIVLSLYLKKLTLDKEKVLHNYFI